MPTEQDWKNLWDNIKALDDDLKLMNQYMCRIEFAIWCVFGIIALLTLITIVKRLRAG
jgi:hypothetical protein